LLHDVWKDSVIAERVIPASNYEEFGARILEGEHMDLHFTGVFFWHSSSNWANTDSVTAMGITGPLYTKSPGTT
jgi:hypothetical protein